MSKYNPFSALRSEASPTKFKAGSIKKSNLAKIINSDIIEKTEHTYEIIKGKWFWPKNSIPNPARHGVLDYLGLSIPYLLFSGLDFFLSKVDELSNALATILIIILFPVLLALYIAMVVEQYILRPILTFALTVAAIPLILLIQPFTLMLSNYYLWQVNKLSKNELTNKTDEISYDDDLKYNTFVLAAKGQEVEKFISYRSLDENKHRLILWSSDSNAKSNGYKALGYKDYSSEQELQESSLMQNMLSIA